MRRNLLFPLLFIAVVGCAEGIADETPIKIITTDGEPEIGENWDDSTTDEQDGPDTIADLLNPDSNPDEDRAPEPVTPTVVDPDPGPSTTDPDPTPNTDPTPAPTPENNGSEVGGACITDSDCADPSATCIGEQNGFPGGYCVVANCESTGCPGASTCYRLEDDSTVCLPDCGGATDCRGGYICDAQNICWPGAPSTCTPGSCPSGEVCGASGQCEPQSCTPGSCGSSMVCTAAGTCVPDVGQPPIGIPSACSNVPSWECTGSPSYCAQLVPFDPPSGDGYLNYPLNGETSTNQYRSYIRRDVMAMIKYAAAKVSCQAGNWSGNGGQLGLGDMSEANGSIPGTAVGSPGHPNGTHENGFDMDIAYFQVGTPDNTLRPICNHISGGADAYHCVAAPDRLDVWRTALFIAHLHDAVVHNYLQLRVIGVDGKVGPDVHSAIEQLCADGWYSGPACNPNTRALAYEETNMNLGWYHFHHHHLHVSTNGLHPQLPASVFPNACFGPTCDYSDPQLDRRRAIYVNLGHLKTLRTRGLTRVH